MVRRMRYESWVIDDKQKAGWRRAAFGQTREHAQTAEQKQIFAHDVFADTAVFRDLLLSSDVRTCYFVSGLYPRKRFSRRAMGRV